MNTDKQLPVIERNFHIMNDDRFIMEKISLPVEIQDGEDIHAAINRTRETIVQNFKAAYPKVYTHLNFDEVIDYRNDVNTASNNPLPNNPAIQSKKFKGLNTDNETTFLDSEYSAAKSVIVVRDIKDLGKINKVPIEEQIQAFEGTPEQLKKEWYYPATMNKKLFEIYDKKMAELQNKNQTV